MSSQTVHPGVQPRRSYRPRIAGGTRSVDLFFEFSTLGLVLCGYLAMLSTGTLDAPTSAVVCSALFTGPFRSSGSHRSVFQDG